LLYKPQIAQKRILIINNCEKLNFTTQSSLLKILEEPKNHFIIILITTNPQKLLKTIKSRLLPIRFIKPTKPELVDFIKNKYPNSFKDLPYLMELSQNRPAQIINFIKNRETLKEKENNIKIYRNISKSNFINQSSIIKELLSSFEKQETKDQTNTESSVKTYLKNIVND
jgi:DNA polymerase III delta prime subunit